MKSPLVFTQRVDVDTKIWLFEVVGALGNTTTAKAPRGLGGLPKQKCVLEVS